MGIDRWSVLGQSFGGFTSMTYLSIAPEGLREAFITGGLSPIGRPVDDIYGATYRRLRGANRRYFERYPDDRARVRDILRRLEDEDVRLPAGDRLTARRFRQLGLWLGDSAGFEHLHHVIELPFGSLLFLHECRVRPAFQQQPDLRDPPRIVVRRRRRHALVGEPAAPGRGRAGGLVHRRARLPVDVGGLRGPGAATAAAGLLAEHEWPRLYDAERLARNEVPVAATIYVNDLYVERDFAEETAAAIRGIRTWQTDEFEHNGLRADGERVLGRLIDLVRGRA